MGRRRRPGFHGLAAVWLGVTLAAGAQEAGDDVALFQHHVAVERRAAGDAEAEKPPAKVEAIVQSLKGMASSLRSIPDDAKRNAEAVQGLKHQLAQEQHAHDAKELEMERTLRNLSAAYQSKAEAATKWKHIAQKEEHTEKSPEVQQLLGRQKQEQRAHQAKEFALESTLRHLSMAYQSKVEEVAKWKRLAQEASLHMQKESDAISIQSKPASGASDGQEHIKMSHEVEQLLEKQKQDIQVHLSREKSLGEALRQLSAAYQRAAAGARAQNASANDAAVKGQKQPEEESPTPDEATGSEFRKKSVAEAESAWHRDQTHWQGQAQALQRDLQAEYVKFAESAQQKQSILSSCIGAVRKFALFTIHQKFLDWQVNTFQHVMRGLFPSAEDIQWQKAARFANNTVSNTSLNLVSAASQMRDQITSLLAERQVLQATSFQAWLSTAAEIASWRGVAAQSTKALHDRIENETSAQNATEENMKRWMGAVQKAETESKQMRDQMTALVNEGRKLKDERDAAVVGTHVQGKALQDWMSRAEMLKHENARMVEEAKVAKHDVEVAKHYATANQAEAEHKKDALQYAVKKMSVEGKEAGQEFQRLIQQLQKAEHERDALQQAVKKMSAEGEQASQEFHRRIQSLEKAARERDALQQAVKKMSAEGEHAGEEFQRRTQALEKATRERDALQQAVKKMSVEGEHAGEEFQRRTQALEKAEREKDALQQAVKKMSVEGEHAGQELQRHIQSLEKERATDAAKVQAASSQQLMEILKKDGQLKALAVYTGKLEAAKNAIGGEMQKAGIRLTAMANELQGMKTKLAAVGTVTRDRDELRHEIGKLAKAVADSETAAEEWAHERHALQEKIDSLQAGNQSSEEGEKMAGVLKDLSKAYIEKAQSEEHREEAASEHGKVQQSAEDAATTNYQVIAADLAEENEALKEEVDAWKRAAEAADHDDEAGIMTKMSAGPGEEMDSPAFAEETPPPGVAAELMALPEFPEEVPSALQEEAPEDVPLALREVPEEVPLEAPKAPTSRMGRVEVLEARLEAQKRSESEYKKMLEARLEAQKRRASEYKKEADKLKEELMQAWAQVSDESKAPGEESWRTRAEEEEAENARLRSTIQEAAMKNAEEVVQWERKLQDLEEAATDAAETSQTAGRGPAYVKLLKERDGLRRTLEKVDRSKDSKDQKELDTLRKERDELKRELHKDTDTILWKNADIDRMRFVVHRLEDQNKQWARRINQTVAAHDHRIKEWKALTNKLTSEKDKWQKTAFRASQRNNVLNQDKAVIEEARTAGEKAALAEIDKWKKAAAGLEAEQEASQAAVRALEKDKEDLKMNLAHWMEEYHNYEHTVQSVHEEGERMKGVANAKFQQYEHAVHGLHAENEHLKRLAGAAAEVANKSIAKWKAVAQKAINDRNQALKNSLKEPQPVVLKSTPAPSTTADDSKAPSTTAEDSMDEGERPPLKHKLRDSIHGLLGRFLHLAHGSDTDEEALPETRSEPEQLPETRQTSQPPSTTRPARQWLPPPPAPTQPPDEPPLYAHWVR